MNNYNDLEQNLEAVQQNKVRKKINIKKIAITLATTLITSFIFALIILHKPISSMEGVWVRLPDDNMDANGMIVEVKRIGGMYVGEVIALNDDSAMPIGTLKWTGFQKCQIDVFVFYDMAFSINPAERTYDMGYAVMSPDGKNLTIYHPDISTSVGAHQVWIKE